jgi:hypothetical protein
MVDIASLASMLNDRVESVIDAIGLSGERRGHDFVALNPTRADRSLGSFRICIAGSKTGVWKDFSGGDGGDVLDLVAYCMFGGDKGKAVAWSKSFLGLDDMDPARLERVKKVSAEVKQKRDAEAEREDAEKKAAAYRIWNAADQDIIGTPADRYLRGRGLDITRLPYPVGSLRFHPSLYNTEAGEKLPAMVAIIVGGDNKFLGVHRTWLEDRGQEVTKAPLEDPKLTLGKFRDGGGAIRLWSGFGPRGGKGRPLGELQATWVAGRLTKNEARCSISEGIEDGLTAALAVPEIRVLVAVNVANFTTMFLPGAIQEVILVADNDAPNSAAAKQLDKAIRRFWNDGRRVRVIRAPDGKDINQLIDRSAS